MISAGVKSNIKQQEVKDLWLYFTNYYKSTFKTSNTMSYSRKKKKTGNLTTYWFESPPKIFRLFSLPLEIVKKCIPSLGNSKTKNQDPWKFHIIFSWSPLEIPHAISLIPLEIPYPHIHIHTPPPVCFFSGTTQCRERVFCFLHLILVSISSILILWVKNSEVAEAFLNGQNPLSVTKVICR